MKANSMSEIEHIYDPESVKSCALWFPCNDMHTGDGQCPSAVHTLKAEAVQACAVLPRRWGLMEFRNCRGRVNSYGKVSLWHGLLTCSFMFLELTAVTGGFLMPANKLKQILLL